ncbi:MAG: replication protein [Butyrivibrio sp.]|nr:replication protein [Butyrivibrio sp.]
MTNLAIAEQDQVQYTTSRDYLQYLFRSTEGYIFRCQKEIVNGAESFVSKYYQAKPLSYQKYAGIRDTYVSMNTFFYSKESKKPERKVRCLKRLNALYVDIDCYKEGMRNDVVLRDLEERVFGDELPYPTFVIDSGRGLYLIWKFKKSEDRNALPRWERTQAYLINALERYGADAACKDAARVLRVPNTINSKSNTEVSVMRYYGYEYTLYGIMKELEIDYSFVKHPKSQRKASDKQKAYAEILASKAGVELPDFESRSATYKFIEKYQDVAPYRKPSYNISYFDKESPKILLKGYISDLHTLFSLRNRPDCKREIALFLCRYWNYELYRDDEQALEETLALNASFAYPFPEKYVEYNTKSAVGRIAGGLRYNYKKQTLIDLLEITREEMANLKYLKMRTKDEEREEKKKRNHNSYVMRLIKNGKITKSMEIGDRVSEIRGLLEDGLSASAIIDKLGISRATYYRMLSKINESELRNKTMAESQEEMDVNTYKNDAVDDKTSINVADSKRNLIFSWLKVSLLCTVSFFKPAFWGRALALLGGEDCEIYYFNHLTGDSGQRVIHSLDGYDQIDDCEEHDTA